MLPIAFETHLRLALEKGETQAVRIETPDPVHTTNEILDAVRARGGETPPAVYIVREDGMIEFSWRSGQLGELRRLPLVQSLDVINGSRSAAAVFIVWNLERALDDRDGQAAVRNFLPQVRLAAPPNKLIALLEPVGSTYPATVLPYVVSYVEPYPRPSELSPMVRRQVARASRQTDTAVERALVDALLGLTYSEAEQTLHLELESNDGAGLEHVVTGLNARKQQMLVRSLGMRFLSSDDDVTPQGFEHLLRDFEIYRSLMCTDGHQRQRAWFLIGEPGVGKTLVARYIARRLGHPAVSWDISAITDGIVGATEKNARRAVSTLEGSAPAVVFIDEFDKAFSGTGDLDGGVMKRMSGIVLEFLSGTEAPLFIVAAANQMPDNPAMVRKGRFDRVFWVDRPSSAARVAIARDAFVGHGVGISEPVLTRLGDETAWFSGADLFGLASEVSAKASYLGITDDASAFEKLLFEEVDHERPRVSAECRQHDRLREWGRASFRPAGLGPEE